MSAVPRRRPAPRSPEAPEPLLRTILDTAVDAFTLIDHDGVIHLWNQQAEAVFGWTAGEAVGHRLSTLILPERYRARLERGLVGGTESVDGAVGNRRTELIACRNDGREIPIELTVVPVLDGTRRMFSAFVRDLSERRHDEALQQFQSSILENIQDSVIAVDLDGCVRYWNRGAEALYGYNRVEMMGRTMQAVLPEGESMAGTVQRILRAGETLEEVRRRRKDGAIVWVELRRSVMRDAHGAITGVLGVAKDVTERRRVTAELERSHGRLRNLAGRLRRIREEERTAIARRIHDEMGQVLTALRLDVVWLEARLSDGQPVLLDKCRTMEQLIEATIGRVRSLATELRPAVLDDLGLPAAIEWETQEFARRTGIRCEVHLANDLAGLDADRATDLFRILQEALTNVARHAMARCVQVTLRVVAGEVVLHVDDDGRGITPAEAVDQRSLGLVGMRERALLWDGSVDVQARSAGGTGVTVRLPLTRNGRTP
jgi:PAS domain S-box-containing protein